MKNILVIDFLTKKEIKKSLNKYDEIWYINGQKINCDIKIKCILDHKSKNSIYWEKEELALNLCNNTYSNLLDDRLNYLHNGLNNTELIHKKHQARLLTDFTHASIIKIFIDEFMDMNPDVKVTYRNNQFLYLHEMPEQVNVVRKLSCRIIFKKLVELNLHFGFFMYNILTMKHKNTKFDVMKKHYDILFFFDRNGQEIEWKYILNKASINNDVAIYYHTKPRMPSISKSDLKDILDVIKTTGIDIEDVFIDNDFKCLNFKERIYHLSKGIKKYITILYYVIGDFKNIEWYMKYFLVDLDMVIYKNVLNKITTKRFITIGEYQPDLNVRTSIWKAHGVITENVVHGIKQAIFEDSYVYLDKIYVWGDVMEKEFKKMDCSIGEYIHSGPMYIHKIFDNNQHSTLNNTIGIFSNDIELVDTVHSWGLGNAKDYKKMFFEYILFCAKKYSQYNFIIFPHPRERERGYVIKDFDSEMTKLPNLTIDFEKDRMGSFKYIKSLDLGITMQSSIGFEMLFAGFKCIFFDTVQEGLHNYKDKYGDIFTNPDDFSMDEWSDFIVSKVQQSKKSFCEQYKVPKFGEHSLANSMFNIKTEAAL